MSPLLCFLNNAVVIATLDLALCSLALGEHKVKWEGAEGEDKSLKMFTTRFYRHPSGYSIPLEKHAACVARSPLLALTHIPHAATRLAQCQWERKSEISKKMEYASKTCNVFVGGFANDNKR